MRPVARCQSLPTTVNSLHSRRAPASPRPAGALRRTDGASSVAVDASAMPPALHGHQEHDGDWARQAGCAKSNGTGAGAYLSVADDVAEPAVMRSVERVWVRLASTKHERLPAQEKRRRVRDAVWMLAVDALTLGDAHRVAHGPMCAGAAACARIGFVGDDRRNGGREHGVLRPLRYNY